MADKSLTSVTAADALDGTELLYAIQGGNTRKATVDQVNTYVGANVDLSGLVAQNAAAFAAEVTVASSSTADALGAASLYVEITGTTTITSLGTGTNRVRIIRFAGALTLTHNASTLILPTGANITTAAGDVAVAVSDGSSNVRVVSYMRADGTALSATTLLDEDDMASDSATAAASQQSIKAYVDGKFAQIATGSYTGDGETSQGITGVGFQPKYVKIWVRYTVAGTQADLWETTDTIMDDNASGGAFEFDVTAERWEFEPDKIIALGSDGFTVDDAGADDHPNTNSTVYNYMAIG